jgi:hypothetical protein
LPEQRLSSARASASDIADLSESCRRKRDHCASRLRVRDEARDLLEDVDKWLDEARLDPSIGAEAIRLLMPPA